MATAGCGHPPAQSDFATAAATASHAPPQRKSDFVTTTAMASRGRFRRKIRTAKNQQSKDGLHLNKNKWLAFGLIPGLSCCKSGQHPCIHVAHVGRSVGPYTVVGLAVEQFLAQGLQCR